MAFVHHPTDGYDGDEYAAGRIVRFRDGVAEVNLPHVLAVYQGRDGYQVANGLVVSPDLPEYQVACPHCGAGPNEMCRSGERAQPRRTPHVARRQAADAVRWSESETGPEAFLPGKPWTPVGDGLDDGL